MEAIKLRHIPNFITFLRLIFLIPISYYLLHEDYQHAFYFFALAGISDGLDGWLARKYKWTSHFGSVVDPLADKLLMIISYSCLAWSKQISYLVFFLVVFRDIWLILGVISFKIFAGKINFQPTLISKINTIFQILLVGFILLKLVFGYIPDKLISLFTFFVILTTTLSLLDYTIVWGIRAYRIIKGKQNAHK